MHGNLLGLLGKAAPASAATAMGASGIGPAASSAFGSASPAGQGGLLGMFGQGGRFGNGLLGMGGPQGQILGMQPNRPMLNAGLSMMGGGMPMAGGMGGQQDDHSGLVQQILAGLQQGQAAPQAPQQMATGAPVNLLPQFRGF